MNTTGFKNIHEIFTFLQEIASARGEQGIAKEIHDADNALVAGRFNVAFLGQFKRGKSTLINSIIGLELLPADVAPLTSVITIVQYGPNERGVVHFTDGREKEIVRDEIRLYASEEGNPGNHKGVGFVLLELPLPILREGIRLVDTPGVGSIFEQSAEATRAFLQRVDVAVFVLGSDPPISGEEIHLVKAVFPLSAHIIFVMNKADQVEEKTRKKAEIFTRKALSEALGYEPGPIIHMSARKALEGDRNSGVEAFLERLEDIAAASRNEMVFQSASKAASHFASRLLQQVNLESAVLLTPVSELELRINRFQTDVKDIDDLILAAWSRAKAEIAYDFKSWESEKERTAAEGRKSILEAVKNTCEKAECGRTDIRHLALKTARVEMKKFMDSWKNKATAWVSRNYSLQAEKVSKETNRLVTRLAEAAAEAFGAPVVKFEVPKASIDLTGITFDFIDPRIALDLNDWLIPILDFVSPRKLVIKRAINRTRKILDDCLLRNFYNVDEHITEWIDLATRQLLSSMSSRLESIRQEIMDAVNSGRKKQENGMMAVADRLNVLENQKTKIEDILRASFQTNAGLKKQAVAD